MWKVSTPSSVTLSEAIWAAIHFSLPLPAVHLLFVSVGCLLPPIHLLCEAAARGRLASWTDGKATDVAFVVFPPNFSWAVSNLVKGGCLGYQMNRLGW